MAETLGGKQINQSEERNQLRNTTHWNGTSSKFPYKVYEMSAGDKSQNSNKQSAFAFREFDRLDTLLNLSMIHRKRALDISRYLVDIGKATIETGLRMVKVHSRNKNERDRNAVKIGRRLISAGDRILSRGEKVLKAVTRSRERKSSTARKRVPTTRVLDLKVVTPVIKMISLCSHGPPHYGVTLLGGIRAGHFVGQGKVDNMQACIKKCCANHECDLAFMVKEDCYSVICYHKKLCRSVRAQHIKKYQPRIAHIWRGSIDEKQSMTSHTKLHVEPHKQGKVKKEESVTSYAKSSPRSQQQLKVKDNFHSVEDQEEERVNSHAKSRLTPQRPLLRKTKLTSVEHQQKESVTDNPETRPTATASSKHRKSARKNKLSPVHKPNKHMFTKGEHSHLTSTMDEKSHQSNQSACPHSSIEHSVGLRRGLKTGNFSYIGELLDINACLEACCHAPDCDIAFMLDQSCYTVNCTNELACRSVPYRQHQYSTKAVFVTRRFNKRTSQHAGQRLTPDHSNGTVKNISTGKPILQSRVTTATHNSGHTTKSTSSQRKLISQINVTTAAVAHVNDSHGTQLPWNGPTIAPAQSDAHGKTTDPSSNINKKLNHYVNNTNKQNSSELWKNEKIKIDLNGGQDLTRGGQESDFLENKSNAVNNERWQRKKINIDRSKTHDLKDESSLREKIKINLIGVENVTQKGKDSDFLKTTGKATRKEKWKSEKIMVHLPTPLYEKSNVTHKLDQNTSTRDHVDTRDNVPKVAVSYTSATFTNDSLLHEKEMENTREKETQGRRSKETVSHREGSVKIKVNLSGKNGLLRGEPEYDKLESEKTNISLPNAGKNSESIEEREDNTGSGEPGMIGGTTFRIKVHLKNENSLPQGEPDYYKPISPAPRSKGNSDLFQETDEQSGNTESGVSSTTSGSGIDYDTGHAVDWSYPESNEVDESIAPQGSAELDTVEDVFLKSQNCTTSDTYYNVTLRGGLKAGNFTFFGIALSKEDCVSRCCITKGCDVTFMVLDRCFLVDCYEDNLCDVIAAKNADKFRPVITYVNVTIVNSLQAKYHINNSLADGTSRIVMNQTNEERNDGTYDVEEKKNGTINGDAPSSYQPDTVSSDKLNQPECTYSESFHNITFRRGHQAGVFTNQGPTDDIRECAQWCCQSQHCDVAFMISQDCFSVRCHSNETCQTLTIHGSKFNPRMVFVEKYRVQLKNKVGDSSRNPLVTPSRSQWSINTRSSAAIYSLTDSLNYYQTFSSRSTLNTPVPLANDSFPRDLVHTKAPALNEETSTADITSDNNNVSVATEDAPEENPSKAPVLNEEARNTTFDNNTESVATENAPDGSPSDFVEVKTDGSKFWWQYYTPQDKHSTNSSLKMTLPDSSDDTSNSTINLANDASPQNMAPTKAPILNVKLSDANSISDNITETDATELVPEHQPSDFVEVKTNGSEYYWQYYTAEDKHLANSSLKMALPDATEDSDNSASSASPPIENSRSDNSSFNSYSLPSKSKYSSPQQIVDGPHSHNPSFKVIIPDVSSDTGSSASLVSSNIVVESLSHEQKGKEQKICNDAKVVNGVTLGGGYYAGVFTRQDNATSMKECMSECCRSPSCNLAFMVAKICYAVQCFSKKKCASVKAHYASKYHPRVAYIRPFDMSLDGFKSHVTDPNVITNRLRCVLDDMSEPKYKVQKGSILMHPAALDLGECAKLCCQTNGCEVAVEENGICYSLNCHGNLKCPKTYLSNSSRSVGVIKDLIQTENTSDSSAFKACDFSQVFQEVVLRGGSQSGKFKYLAEVEDMESCIKECCRHKVCDVALMLKDNCFLVSCHNEMLCDSIPSRSSEYHPQIAYKIKHGMRRHVGKRQKMFTFRLLVNLLS